MALRDLPDPKALLVILPTWVGDFVMATPALRAIRERFAAARMTFLLEANLLGLAEGGPWMDECITWPPRAKRNVLAREYREFVRSLRRRRFECVILLSNSFRSALLARLIGARRRIGYDRDGRGWLLTDRITAPNRASTHGRIRRDYPSLATTAAVQGGARIPGRPGKFIPMPLVEYYADLVGAFGCERPGDTLELFTSSKCEETLQEKLDHKGTKAQRHEAGAPWIIVSPGAKFGASKCWSPQRFAHAADHLIEESGATVFITSGPGEEPIARAISEGMRHKGHALIDPLLTLGELKALIRRCDLLICNDAGPRHIAKAFGVPVVTIFGPTHPDWTATNYSDERNVRVDVDCGPCQQRICPLGHHQCMELVSVEMVVAAAKDLLGRRLTQMNADKRQGAECAK